MSEGQTCQNVDIKVVPESYIEQLFIEKSNGNNIFNWWLNDKYVYSSITDTTVLDFQHFSMHDRSHSRNILNAIGLLLGKERLQKLELGDLWLLLESAYYHDIGMATTYDEVYHMWTEDDDFRHFFKNALSSNVADIRIAAKYVDQAENLILKKNWKIEETEDNERIEFDNGWAILLRRYILLVITEYIRKNHGKRAMNRISEFISLNDERLEPRLYEVIADISYLHTMDFDEIFHVLKPMEIFMGNTYMHPQFVAALLRMGDLLDMDNNRFNVRIIKHFGKLPYISDLHFKKHKSLRHINITTDQIMAEAESDNIEVCKVVSDWFRWLDEETEDFICNWNRIVPSELGGCMLNRCQLKVFHRKEEFKDCSQMYFEIDKKYAVDLLIGDNIYRASFDFLREYIQNALDATKLEVDKELKSGKLDYLLKRKLEDFQECMPFYLKEEVFKRFTIHIHLTLDKDEMLEISIIDSGVGIEESGMKAVTTIGGGWSKRKEYSDQLNNVIGWLKPTGGFGIGIQAAFMITDSVEFQTKARSEQKGRIIRMTDPRKDGIVTQETASHIADGTVVKFKIPIIQFMDHKLYEQAYPSEVMEQYYSPFVFAGENYFDTDQLLKNVEDAIYQFLERQLINSLFPIALQCENKKRRYINSKLFYHSKDKYDDTICWKEFKQEIIDGRLVYYYVDVENGLNVTVIDKKSMVMTYIDFMDKKHFIEYYFKGVEVKGEWKELPFCGGNIDILAGNVKEYLKLHRHEFIKDFDKDMFTRKNIQLAHIIFFEHFVEKMKSPEEKQRILSRGKHGEFENMVMSLITNLPKKMIDSLINNIKPADMTMRVLGIKYIQFSNGSYTRTEKVTTSNYYELIWDVLSGKKMIFLESQERVKGKAEKMPLIGNEFANKRKNQQLMQIQEKLNEQSCFVVNNPNDEGIKRLFDMFPYPKYQINCSEMIFTVFGVEKEDNRAFIGEIIDFEEIRASGRSIVIKNVHEYPELHVSKVPFTASLEGKNSTHYLITPLDGESMNLIDKEILDNLRTFNVFYESKFEINSTLKPELQSKYAIELERRVNWVYENQCIRNKYEKDDIRRAYKRFIQEYYNFRKDKLRQ